MNEQIDKIYQQVIDEDCPNPLYRFAELVDAAARKDEREACAKLCESIDAEYEGEDVLATWCAEEIRARGK
jgi:hypothetical protein